MTDTVALTVAALIPVVAIVALLSCRVVLGVNR